MRCLTMTFIETETPENVSATFELPMEDMVAIAYNIRRFCKMLGYTEAVVDKFFPDHDEEYYDLAYDTVESCE